MKKLALVASSLALGAAPLLAQTANDYGAGAAISGTSTTISALFTAGMGVVVLFIVYKYIKRGANKA